MSNLVRSAVRGIEHLVVLLFVLLGLIFIWRFIEDQKSPGLKRWHTETLTNEFFAGRAEVPDFQAYLRLEDRLFQELDERISDRLPREDQTSLDRYFKKALSSPDQQPRNWNRSFVVVPPHPTGVVVLLHGLTDSPYTMHAMAEFYVRQGYAVFLPRLPGHGTIPGALRRTRWNDWTAAVQLTCQAAQEVPRGRGPFVLCGYSNGGLLAVQYVLDELKKGRSSFIPDRLVLFAPAIGITRFAAFAGLYQLLPTFRCFAKFAWLNLEPEYDPFKYNSFPKMAGDQTYHLTKIVNRELEALEANNGFERFPPVLTFTSVVDSTVLTPALVTRFYSKLKNKSELVLYDVNRNEAASQFIRNTEDPFLSELRNAGKANYTLTLITNERLDTLRVIALQRAAESSEWTRKPLGLAWPRGVYSLSHLAIPNAPDDPLYGNRLDLLEKGKLELGLLQPRGETNILNVSAGQFLRLRFNPFYPDMENRVRAFIGTRASR